MHLQSGAELQLGQHARTQEGRQLAVAARSAVQQQPGQLGEQRRHGRVARVQPSARQAAQADSACTQSCSFQIPKCIVCEGSGYAY